MGADFMFAVSPRCELTTGRKKLIKDVIRAIPDKELLEVVDEYCPLGLGDDATPEEIRVTLYRAVLENAEVETSDTSYIRLEGMDWTANITGGISWGDSPTDAFDDLAGISSFDPVYDLMIEFSREDIVIQNNRRGGSDGT